ncbi:radical SAM protein [Glycomyces sp. L485]|nr:radical SAM protein [Glycomyces sp. L485]
MTEIRPARRDRDEIFIEYTKSICPVCKTVLDAQVNIREDQVFLRKRCKDHGEFEARVYGDAKAYLDSARFNKPGTIPREFQTEVKDGCPSDCGLCPEHKQHACLGIIEVNTGCNLDCPICFADSGHQSDGYSITKEQCELMLDTFVAAEGEPEVVMFSGGEPTIHKHILEFIDMALERPIAAVNLNSNGIRLASDKRFVAALGERNQTPGKRIHIYLQFDGFERDTHLQVRNRDLREIKQRALDNCADAGLTVTLVAAVEAGLNEHELGDIVEHGLAHPAVRSVSFQPVTHSGRHVEFDPMKRLTNSDIIAALAEQRPQWFVKDDYFPVPCCFPTCRSITYLLTEGRPGEPVEVDGSERMTFDGGVLPIPRMLDVENYLDYVSNRVLPDLDVQTALERLWSASATMGTDLTEDRLRTAAEALDCADACGVNLPDALADLGARAFMIVIQDFQDPYTLNVKQLMKCCVEEITPDGRMIPFCAYNSVGYREQVRAEQSGVEVADVVPNATTLQDVITESPYGSKQLKLTEEPKPIAKDATNVGRKAVER